MFEKCDIKIVIINAMSGQTMFLLEHFSLIFVAYFDKTHKTTTKGFYFLYRPSIGFSDMLVVFLFSVRNRQDDVIFNLGNVDLCREAFYQDKDYILFDFCDL